MKMRKLKTTAVLILVLTMSIQVSAQKTKMKIGRTLSESSPVTATVLPDVDGGLTIYIQHLSPGKDKETNWFAGSREWKMRLAFRAYWPDAEVQKGLWSPPGIVAVN